MKSKPDDSKTCATTTIEDTIMDDDRIQDLERQIDALRQGAETLSQSAKDFPAIHHNARRVLAGIRNMRLALGSWDPMDYDPLEGESK
jgi:hypothetical protein